MDLMKTFEQYCKYLILLSHVKDKMIKKKGTEVSQFSIDLTGKLSSLIPSKADAVGYLYIEDDKGCISFESGDDMIIGGRCPHLRGKVIEVSEAHRDKDTGDITSIETFMDRIYLPETK